ncbi:MAG: DUF1631 domain-containing protein [Polaromonas sp.]|nr:DUF1631 domain-containing protein [Polaromonas sp.]
MASVNSKNTSLADQARGLFAERAARVLPVIAKAVHEQLSTMADQRGGAQGAQSYRAALQSFQKSGGLWVNATARAWKAAQSRAAIFEHSRATESRKFELMGNEVVEDKILASRLALRILDFASWELSDLRLRIQSLEGVNELPVRDILRPEVLAQHMVAQWSPVDLPREMWPMVQDTLQRVAGEHLLEVYHDTNEFLVQQGVMVEIDLRPLVRRTAGGAMSRAVAIQEETRMQTGTTPLARARIRAQGVMGHLGRLLSERVLGYDDTRPLQASRELNRVMSREQKSAEETSAFGISSSGASVQTFGPAEVERAMEALRDRATSFKRAASTPTEKATVEIVALMFQSILAEDRIPAVIRVWFARLQIPVLRVAIAEPEFFGSLQHPARRLIDRMGSCMLGFNVTVSGGAMESEVRRAVQVIEQYPETGQKVFQIVYDEFEKFLAKFLSEQGTAALVVSVAQQVEQKETMAIQYTIEMRNILKDMSVRDEIRDFLFKVWTEALAIASMKYGAQHADTLLLKRVAADLVWAASAKPSRQDRAQVISSLPKLLQSLRTGMSLLSMDVADQDIQIKTISDTLADAFASKTPSIPVERIEAMAARLNNLEDYLSDEDLGDLPLDTDSLVTILGIDPAELTVITDGGSQPTDAMRGWVQELQVGSWFTLDHNGQISNVQFAWCSERKQLHLFAASDGRNFLIQARRLAAYLQAGLLIPVEEEALTVRATREALAKLNANPERLLG